MKNWRELKEALKAECGNFQLRRLANIDEAIEAAQSSANEETKSSSGDKYETGRSMAQLEIQKLLGQRENAKYWLAQLEMINSYQQSTVIQLGSVVKTNEGNYFISIPAGKMEVFGTLYVAISLDSPIAKALLTRSANTISFNNKMITIEAID